MRAAEAHASWVDAACRGCGQGIGAVDKVQGAGDLVKQLLAQYAQAKER